tara:strand:- start:1248 stop:1538 length:291 start_codon:yes stop_codon:yes gene_type:complete
MPHWKVVLLVIGTVAGVVSAYMAVTKPPNTEPVNAEQSNHMVIQKSTAASHAGPGGNASSTSTVNNSITINQIDNRVVSGGGGIVVGPGATVKIGK